jgi:hypothetical protein
MKYLICALCVLVLAGCSSVLMQEPFAETQLTQKEQEQLAGTWRTERDVVQIAFSRDGIPWLAAVEWKDDDFQLKKYRLRFTRHNDALYLSMPGEADQPDGDYFFAQVGTGAQGLNVWIPDADVFTELVAEGALEGSVEKGEHTKTIRLTHSPGEILELISTNTAAIDYRNPILFLRMK